MLLYGRFISLTTCSASASLAVLLVLMSQQNLFLLNYLCGWFLTGLIGFWLVSVARFFFKTYKFSKFTSSVQRFWRRLYNIFWIVEIFWFGVFIYCLLAANHEPVQYEELYMYKSTYICSSYLFLQALAWVAPIAVILHRLTASVAFLTYTQVCMYFFGITVFYLNILYTELYQFFNVISFFMESVSIFDTQTLFTTTTDYWRFRPRVAFFALVLMAKFWHALFIVLGWVLFVFKTVELKTVKIAPLAMATQNTIVLYIMCWIVTAAAIKAYMKIFVKKMWYWFFFSPIPFNFLEFALNVKIQITAITSLSFSFNYFTLPNFYFSAACDFCPKTNHIFSLVLSYLFN